ncbi:uncharacterized protein LOC124192721 [Daphnia pulex]|uniref:uncharacterized protein LOC124192721 n=2 Tax=Daphnia TaxID=6668 RepID=UPI001EDEE4E8|nr:uncharacterized protein LOC124192721 [Daphnia pulex]
MPQGSAATTFELTETLNGHIAAVQKNSSQHLSPHFVSTGEETQLVVKFHDPEHFLNQAQDLIFYWFVNDVNYGTTKTPVLKFNFTEVKNHTVMVDVYATFAEPTTTTTTTTTSTTPSTIKTTEPTTAPSTTALTTSLPTNSSSVLVIRSKRRSHYTHYERFIGYKVALFTLELQARDPISNVSIHGNNWLKHGDIMNMNISCNGSAPFYYCWAFDGFMNETTNASCELPIKTNKCEVQLLHYFSSPGQYILPVVLYNQVFYQVIPLKVNIYEADRKAQLSLVVVPIASACVAIVSIAFGIGLYFYTRRNLRIEVADFDFEEEDVGNPESFSGRLRSSMVQYWSGLKGQTPPANTSYQNITFD